MELDTRSDMTYQFAKNGPPLLESKIFENGKILENFRFISPASEIDKNEKINLKKILKIYFSSFLFINYLIFLYFTFSATCLFISFYFDFWNTFCVRWKRKSVNFSSLFFDENFFLTK